MLDEIDPAVLQELYALSVIQGWGEEWKRAGTIAAASHNGSLFAALLQLAPSGSDVEPALPDDYIPRLLTNPKARSESRANSDSTAISPNSLEFERRLNRMAGYD